MEFCILCHWTDGGVTDTRGASVRGCKNRSNPVFPGFMNVLLGVCIYLLKSLLPCWGGGELRVSLLPPDGTL